MASVIMQRKSMLRFPSTAACLLIILNTAEKYATYAILLTISAGNLHFLFSIHLFLNIFKKLIKAKAFSGTRKKDGTQNRIYNQAFFSTQIIIDAMMSNEKLSAYSRALSRILSLPLSLALDDALIHSKAASNESVSSGDEST